MKWKMVVVSNFHIFFKCCLVKICSSIENLITSQILKDIDVNKKLHVAHNFACITRSKDWCKLANLIASSLTNEYDLSINNNPSVWKSLFVYLNTKLSFFKISASLDCLSIYTKFLNLYIYIHSSPWLLK